MAITITPQILGQIATSSCSYCYLYEPFNIFIEESDLTAIKMYIDIDLISTDVEAVDLTLTDYVEYDINSGVGITIDLMKVVRQINDANIWKFSSVNNLVASEGWKAVLANYRFKFKIRTDQTVTPVEVYKMPILGGRSIEQFVPAITETSPINEFQYFGLDEVELSTRWGGNSLVLTDLLAPNSALSIKPTLTKVTNAGTPPCGGFILWKSRFGGWMWWGFDLQTEESDGKQTGSLEVGMYESTLEKSGEIYVPLDYTGISTRYTKKLKALNLTTDELRAVSGIHAAQVVYYRHLDGRLEAMRLSSYSAPISSIADGGDFSVTLKSISQQNQLTV